MSMRGVASALTLLSGAMLSPLGPGSSQGGEPLERP